VALVHAIVLSVMISSTMGISGEQSQSDRGIVVPTVGTSIPRSLWDCSPPGASTERMPSSISWPN
jgi:hypothetical protein